jgi:Tfp pilus assembly protein PilN
VVRELAVREPDFLPAWYPTVRRRRTILIVQSWATLAIVLIGTFLVFSKHNHANAAQANLSQLLAAMDHTRSDLKRLDDLLALEAKWRQRDQVLMKLGMHVESSRLLNKLAEVLPNEMAILDLDLGIEEEKLKVSPLVKATEAAKNVPVDRRMKVRLHGVAPTDVDLSNFLRDLSSITYFENVTMSYAKDRSQDGHMMREFQVEFTINLNGGAVN